MSTNYLRQPLAEPLVEYTVFQDGVETGRIYSRNAARALVQAQRMFPEVTVTVAQSTHKQGQTFPKV